MGDLSKAGLGQLLGALTPGQIVAVVTVGATLVTASFGFGAWLGSTFERTAHESTKLALTRVQSETERAQGETGRAQAELARISAEQAFLQTKEQFLGLLVLWHDTAQRVRAGDTDPELLRRHDELSDNLFAFVMELVERSASGDANAQVRTRLGKGISPTLTFERDGSTFPLPGLFATAQ